MVPMGTGAFKSTASGVPEPPVAQVLPMDRPPFLPPNTDRLAEIDLILEKRHVDEKESAERRTRLMSDKAEFAAEFDRICSERVRPTMESILERIRQNGGGGYVEERSEDLSRLCSHRITLWISLSGEIVGMPRQNRQPYLQLDADVESRVVMVSEGDMWQGKGGERNGLSAQWPLREITAVRVTEEVVEILRRSAQVGPESVKATSLR